MNVGGAGRLQYDKLRGRSRKRTVVLGGSVFVEGCFNIPQFRANWAGGDVFSPEEIIAQAG